jgi:hypothetical protein
MPEFNGVTVDASEGPRWELALALIDSGEGQVRLGEVEISRNVVGPTADGVIRMTDYASRSTPTARSARPRSCKAGRWPTKRLRLTHALPDCSTSTAVAGRSSTTTGWEPCFWAKADCLGTLVWRT